MAKSPCNDRPMFATVRGLLRRAPHRASPPPDRYPIRPRPSTAACFLKRSGIVGMLIGVVCFEAASADTNFWKASGANGVIAAGTREAAEAGLAVLKGGGNAVDAAVTAVLVLSVTDPGNFCFGSEMPMLVYDAGRGVVEAIIGLGAAPRLATREFFDGIGGIPGEGDIRTATPPGALDALLTALERHGTIRFSDAAGPMLGILERQPRGWRKDLGGTVRRLIEAERASTGDRRRGLRLVADYFYRGPIAREIDAWSRARGGILRASDLATHVTRIEEAVSVDYRGYTVLKCGPVTQGPFLLQTLRLLEGFDLRAAGHNRGDYAHLLIEAMKLGLADRDTYYGDPLFVEVPMKELLARDYAAMRRGLIDLRLASLEQRPGDPVGRKPLLAVSPRAHRLPGSVRDTTTCVVADRWGNVVAATPSGQSVSEPAGDTGVTLGTRLRCLNTWPGHPNCVEPGKRPRITLTPTLVLRDGKPVFAVSVAGSDWQDQVTLQVLLNMIEFGLDPAAAVTAPRLGTDHLIGSFNQPAPALGKVTLYRAFGDEVLADLRARGHKLEVVSPPFWHPVALRINPVTGWKEAAGDPAAQRHAAGY